MASTLGKMLEALGIENKLEQAREDVVREDVILCLAAIIICNINIL